MMNEENLSLEGLVKDLASTVKSLQQEVSGLKKDREGAASAPRPKNKRPRDDEDVADSESDAETHRTRDGESSEDESVVPSDAEGNTPRAYAVSTEGEAFLETTFGSKLDYAARRKQVDKMGSPDTKWVKTSVLPPVMASILPKETVKEDRRSFRAQQLWLEAAVPLVSLLETAHEGKLDPKTAVTMVQSALLLMGDASQHQSASRRETILKQLNPQIAVLMKEEDYTKALPFLFGEDFGAKVKTRMEEAAALKKTLSQPSKGKEKAGFHGGYPWKNTGGRGGGLPNVYGPGPSKKWRPAPTTGNRPGRK